MNHQRTSFALAAVAWLLAFLSAPVFAAIAFGVSGDTVVDTRDLVSGAVARYEFDGTASDSSGNHLDGAVSNGGFAAGRFGMALDTRSSTAAVVEVPHNNLLTPSTNLTLSLWVFPTAHRNSFDCLIYKAGATPGASGFADRCYSLWLRRDSGIHFTATAPGAAAQTALDSPANVVPLNQWSNVVATIDGTTHEMRIYVNDVLKATAPFLTNIRQGAFPLRIGGPFLTLGDQAGFSGLIDRVEIYAKSYPFAVENPAVATLPATLIGSTSANFRGTVNRAGLTVVRWFEWGTSADALPSSTPTRSVTGTGAVPVEERIVGLTAGETYYYRVVVALPGGVAIVGDVLSFIAEDAADRGFAKVSVKGSGSMSEVGPRLGRFTISRSGPTNVPLTVILRMEGQALNGVDYNFVPSTVVIPVGAKSVKLDIIPRADGIVEGVESVNMRVMPSFAYRVGTALAKLAIRENDTLDAPYLQFSSDLGGQIRKKFENGDTVGETTGTRWYRINAVPPQTLLNLTVTGPVDRKTQKHQRLNCNVALALYDEAGELVDQSDHETWKPEFISKRMIRGGDYLIAVSYVGPLPPLGNFPAKKTAFMVTVSGGENWALIENVKNENGDEVHHVGLVRPQGSPEPIPGSPTWIVTHGRINDPSYLMLIGKQLPRADPGSQVYMLDWQTAAEVTGIADYSNGRWFVKIGEALGARLSGEGTGAGRFMGSDLSYVGHSWGTFVSYEIARNMKVARGLGPAARFVALDPAKVVANYSNNLVNFSTVSAYSMGFQSSDFGDEERVAECTDGFQINAVSRSQTTRHRAAHLAFRSLLLRNNPIGDLLKPVLFNGTAPAWKENPPNFHTVTHFKTGTRTTTFVGLVDDRFEGRLDADGDDWHFTNFYYEAE